MTRAGPAAEKLDLLAATPSRNCGNGSELPVARLADTLTALFKRLAVQPEGIAVVPTIGDGMPDEHCIRFTCKNEAGHPGAIIDMPSTLLERLFVQIYGGDRFGAPIDPPSGTQQRFAQRLGNQLCEWLGAALPDPSKQRFTQAEARFGKSPGASDRIGIEAPIAVQFEITLSGSAPCKMHIAIAASLIAASSAPPSQHRHSIHPTERNQMILSRTGHVTLPVRSEIAIARISASRLLALQPGEVLPIVMPASIPVLVGERPFASASMGEWQGSAALRIEALNESQNP
ncbi:MAG: FliM/FliN family flagellar motor switch protein [Sphingomonadales bacterium]|nr:FliM/FliN family flagellar motor switch protein [Sphingomonadales bacterium]MBK9004763.1 FliM/FliN family flagellar motor switch protein [Sphingomonadales bacterium]MBK9267510.1 FliM/FliN family flagellar motor switch protein [Sphingomonadales bacterium]MBP6434448.1 FliM/FliN family flagellar motor switch protein [Sphingorhabdus sp.]